MLTHKDKVKILIYKFCEDLKNRAEKHDDSKFDDKIERDGFINLDEDGNLWCKNGDGKKEKYERALERHYENNKHHVEYWGNVEYMRLIDIIEMYFDWCSYGVNIEDTKNIIKNNAIRYNISDQLRDIMVNSI